MSIRRIRRRRGPNINPKFCPKCGARNDYHAKFCKICATPLGLDQKEIIDGSDKK